MEKECEKCGHDPETVSKKYRRSLFECPSCERTLCSECLKKIGINNNLINPDTADLIDESTGGLMFHCSEESQWLCGDCYESE